MSYDISSPHSISIPLAPPQTDVHFRTSSLSLTTLTSPSSVTETVTDRGSSASSQSSNALSRKRTRESDEEQFEKLDVFGNLSLTDREDEEPDNRIKRSRVSEDPSVFSFSTSS